MNVQYIGIAGIIVVLAIIALMLWKQDIPIPGMPWKVEVTVDVERGIIGEPVMNIADWRVYRGFSLKPTALPPLLFPARYRLVMETPVDRTSVTFSIDLSDTETVIIRGDMPDPPTGRIVITLYDMGGQVMEDEEITI